MTGSTDPDLLAVTGAELERIFDATEPLTVGLEEEVMLLDPSDRDLAPVAAALLDRLAGDARFKAELPASQLEIVVEPSEDPRTALAALDRGRRDLAGAAAGIADPAVAGVHPFAAARGALAAGKRYERTHERYASVAERQLVTSLQVHVAIGRAELTLAVYNALRSYLPEIAALAANAPIHEGADTGLASVRPTIAVGLPRQGLPPRLASWEEFATELRWGARAGTVTEPRQWWWELRPHVGFGTLEVRVADAQTTLADAAGVVAFVHTLVAWLRQRAAEGEMAPAPPTWRIAENRWSALRHGVEGEMADLRTGELEPTRVRLQRLIGELEPVAQRVGSNDLLERTAALVRENGAIRQRRVAGEPVDATALAAWIADRFLEPPA